jgi:hypothetical protein
MQMLTSVIVAASANHLANKICPPPPFFLPKVEKDMVWEFNIFKNNDLCKFFFEIGPNNKQENRYTLLHHKSC